MLRFYGESIGTRADGLVWKPWGHRRGVQERKVNMETGGEITMAECQGRGNRNAKKKERGTEGERKPKTKSGS